MESRTRVTMPAADSRRALRPGLGVFTASDCLCPRPISLPMVWVPAPRPYVASARRPLRLFFSCNADWDDADVAADARPRASPATLAVPRPLASLPNSSSSCPSPPSPSPTSLPPVTARLRLGSRPTLRAVLKGASPWRGRVGGATGCLDCCDGPSSVSPKGTFATAGEESPPSSAVSATVVNPNPAPAPAAASAPSPEAVAATASKSSPPGC